MCRILPITLVQIHVHIALVWMHVTVTNYTGMDACTDCIAMDACRDCTGMDACTECTGMDACRDCTGMDACTGYYRLHCIATHQWLSGRRYFSWTIVPTRSLSAAACFPAPVRCQDTDL